MTTIAAEHAPGSMMPLVNAGIIKVVSWLTIEAISLVVTVPVGIAVLAAGTTSALLTAVARLPRWWCLIGLVLPPVVALSLYLPVDPVWYVAAFLLTLSIFRGAAGERIPLYLSGRRVLAALEELLPATKGARVIDLGAGLGSTLAYLSRRRPDLQFTGFENAPLSFLLARTRLAWQPNVTVRYRSFWNEDLSHHDFVYAYLSPAPMTGLWRKVAAEMRPGTCFASYRFAVPDVPPTKALPLRHNRPDWLYLWQR